MCEIVNFRHYRSIGELNLAFADRWLSIGRQNRAAGLPQSPLANPFRARDYGRGQTSPFIGAGYGSGSRAAIWRFWKRCEP